MNTQRPVRYLSGDDFDPVAYEKEHLNRLIESARFRIKHIDKQYIGNLKNTIARWLLNHAATPHRAEYTRLKALHDSL